MEILQGNCLDILQTLPSDSVHCVVTSPPYWGLRDYGVAGQIGLEPTPEEYVTKMVAVFREVRRVLRPDGSLWLNLGDCYSSGNSGQRVRDTSGGFQPDLKTMSQGATKANPGRPPVPGMKKKDLVGVPKLQKGWQPTCSCVEPTIIVSTPCSTLWADQVPTPVPCTVLDPFGGSGTTGAVAQELGRRGIIIELNPDYCGLARGRKVA